MTFDAAMEFVVVACEQAGIDIRAIGSLRALVTAGAALARGERQGVYERSRVQVGQAISSDPAPMDLGRTGSSSSR